MKRLLRLLFLALLSSPALAESPVLQTTFVAEIDYRAFSSPAQGNSGFALGRLRPGLNIQPVPWLTAVGSLELAASTPALLDAFVRLRLSEEAELSFGRARPPLFASYIYEPTSTMPFPTLSPLVQAFIVSRDLGLDLHLKPRALPFEGWLRLGSGTGGVIADDQALPAGYLLLDLVLGRARPQPVSRRYGLRLGVGALLESVESRPGISGRTPMGFVHSRPGEVSGRRALGEAHLVAYAGPLRLSLEGALAQEERRTQGLSPLLSRGFSGELVWVLRGEPREVGRAPRAELEEGQSPWEQGALELAARYDGLRLGEGAPETGPGGSRGGALVLKWWPRSFLAASLSGHLTRFDSAPLEAPDELWSWGLIARASFIWSARR